MIYSAYLQKRGGNIRPYGILLSSNLLKQVDALDKCRQQTNAEGEVLLGKLPFWLKRGAAGVGTNAVLAVVKVDHRFF